MSYIIFPKFRIRLSIFALPTFALMLWLEGAFGFFAMIVSALLHELGHVFAIKLCGYRVRRIDILPMGALIVVPEGMPDFCEFIIALSGPAVSLLFGIVSVLGFYATASVEILFFGFICLVLGAFNLMPIKKLDGGKALLSLMRHRKIKNADRISACAHVISLLLVVFVLSLCYLLSSCNLGVLILSLALILQLG